MPIITNRGVDHESWSPLWRLGKCLIPLEILYPCPGQLYDQPDGSWSGPQILVTPVDLGEALTHGLGFPIKLGTPTLSLNSLSTFLGICMHIHRFIMVKPLTQLLKGIPLELTLQLTRLLVYGTSLLFLDVWSLIISNQVNYISLYL